MKFGYAMTLTTAMALSLAQEVYAHPGHVHGPGPAHGFSWMDLALFLVAAAAVPAVALFIVHRRDRRVR